MLKKYIFPLVAVLTLLTAAGYLFFPVYKNSDENGQGYVLAQSSPPAGVPVETARVRREVFVDVLEALGTVKANESVTITPTVEDRVTDIFFDDGDHVREGQVLVKLDSRESRQALAEAKATLKEQLRQVARMRQLTRTNAASQARLDEEESQLQIAEARVAQLQARLTDYTIRAPFSGILGIRRISPGAVVDSDMELTTLDDISTVKIDFTLPENVLGILKTGMTVTADSAAFPGVGFKGTVTAISTRVDPETRSVTVRATLPNPDLRLKPGMLLTVALVKEENQVLVVPEEAVIQEKDRKFAFVVMPDNNVEKKEIITARRKPGVVEIVSGLAVEDQVVVKGTNRIRSGTRVTVVDPFEAG